jgi:hypothetical protein
MRAMSSRGYEGQRGNSEAVAANGFIEAGNGLQSVLLGSLARGGERCGGGGTFGNSGRVLGTRGPFVCEIHPIGVREFVTRFQ